jgi:hypothetical protein
VSSATAEATLYLSAMPAHFLSFGCFTLFPPPIILLRSTRHPNITWCLWPRVLGDWPFGFPFNWLQAMVIIFFELLNCVALVNVVVYDFATFIDGTNSMAAR